ncbi:MAG: N-formylglutamate amidohydrolase [Sphingomonas sp.]|uniref:N-formylglutamate amidohydrolase n=1 Tax=Sphingomonas sp. TaxID=28214 RepID=UPI0017E5B5C8|nr:N-formylglutamate amidohydrolase [Zymomonas sp.]MBA4773259.1 N-formylglutamate amidohydrolase [Sphingomonas sp.]
MADSAASFDRLGPAAPTSPVVVSVPHGGRDYPAAMLAAIRAPVLALRPLEDRHVDTLARAARGDEAMIIQRVPRAWIDLNRSEQERDPLLDDGANPKYQPAPSLKLRSGLGLVPRRVGAVEEIWRGRLRGTDVTARIINDYRPYHATVAAALRAARARFGCAVLVDLHSMPPLRGPGEAAQIVFGDRFGRSAAARFIARIEAEATATGIGHALNTPYAGGHILDAHGAPARGLHAVQIEIDRRLYLDDALDQPGAGLAATAALLRRMFAALADEALAGRSAIAAE